VCGLQIARIGQITFPVIQRDARILRLMKCEPTQEEYSLRKALGQPGYARLRGIEFSDGNYLLIDVNHGLRMVLKEDL
jgi:hypothetical protein